MDRITEKFINDEKLPLVIEPKDSSMGKEDLLDLIDKENIYFKP